LLQKSPIKQQIVWLDCCYSGELLNFEEADIPSESERDICFIAASREYEKAEEEIHHGVLTEALLQRLDPNPYADDMGIDNYTLEEFINSALKGKPQQPLWKRS